MDPEQHQSYRIKNKMNDRQRNVVMLLAIIAVGILFAVGPVGIPALQDLILSNQLQDATITEGTVVDRYTTGGEDRIDNYYIVYRLDEFADGAEDSRFERASRVSEDRYFALKKGDRITVRYALNDPTISMAQETFENSASNTVVLACTGCMALIAIMLAITALLGFRYDIGQAFNDTMAKGQEVAAQKKNAPLL